MSTKQVLYTGGHVITTQDVLDEIALAISLSGCPLRCKNCHNAFTWNPRFGVLLTDELLEELIAKNKYISCVLFYGGEWQLERLLELISIVKKHGLSVCLYTGLMLEEIKLSKKELLSVLDYIKVGRYIEEKGGLNKKGTNQRFYRILNNGKSLEDWTNRFHQS